MRGKRRKGKCHCEEPRRRLGDEAIHLGASIKKDGLLRCARNDDSSCESRIADYELRLAHVVFVDETSLWWLRLLPEGFRHCYLMFNLFADLWLELNPMSNRTVLFLREIPNRKKFFAALEKEKKATVLKIKIPEPPLIPMPLSAFTCVEAVKRVLGIRSFFTLTPRQLYNQLKIVGKKS